RERARDYAYKDFLGIFEHRIISLFFRAWVKSHAMVGFGRVPPPDAAGTTSPTPDWLTTFLLSIVGLSTPGLCGRLPIPDEAMLYYAGLFALPSRPAAALEQLISDYFDVPCEVEQFVGAWYPLTQPDQTALGEFDSVLGAGAVAGDEVWDQQG